MDLNYKLSGDSDFHQRNITFTICNSDSKKDADLLNPLFKLFHSFIFFSDPFDFDNLLQIGSSILSKLQQIDNETYYEIFSYENFILLHHLTNLVANTETYTKNNHLIHIIFSIICEIFKSNDIDISIFSTQSFFDCLFNFSIPNMRENDSSALMSPVLTLIIEILKYNTVAIDIFVENGFFIKTLTSNFDSMDNEDQIRTCEIFEQIINQYAFDQKLTSLEDSSYSNLKNFIEDKMFYFESQPFYVLDLISKSIRREFVSLSKLYAIKASAVEEIIEKSISDKEHLYKVLNSILNIISSAFSLNTNSEDSEDFISNFQWSFFTPILSFISNEKHEFDPIDDDFQMTLCNTFTCIFKRSEFLAEICKKEINLLDILLNLASSFEVSYKVKEASINALMSLIMIDYRLVFFIGDEKEHTLINDYLFILIEFLESNSNDYFLQSVINSILYITICAESKFDLKGNHQMLIKSEKSDDIAFNDMIDEFIIASLLECEENLRAKIESAFSNIQMSDDNCQELLLSLQQHLQNFYKITKQ